MTAQTFRATLPDPVGVNATYGIGYDKQTRKMTLVRSGRSKNWEAVSLPILLQAGFKPQKEQPYWCSITLDLYTSRLDLDAPIKATLDLIKKALSSKRVERKPRKIKGRTVYRDVITYHGVDDKWFGQLIVHKHFCSPKKEQRIEIIVEIEPIKDKKEFNRKTAQRREQCLKVITKSSVTAQDRSSGAQPRRRRAATTPRRSR